MLVQGVKKGYLKFLLHSACPLGPRQLRSKKSTMLFILVFNKQYILRVSFFFWILVQHHSTIILSIILRFFHILVTQNQPHTFSSIMANIFFFFSSRCRKMRTKSLVFSYIREKKLHSTYT